MHLLNEPVNLYPFLTLQSRKFHKIIYTLLPHQYLAYWSKNIKYLDYFAIYNIYKKSVKNEKQKLIV